MANLKNIVDLPMAESAEGLNLIVNDNGAAKQIAAHEVGAQADWNITDEKNPGFIKNKPEVVKSVNGVLPDENGGVQIETSWNDLKDKPFYSKTVEKTVEYTPDMDGPLEDFPTFTIGDTVTVKVDGVEYSMSAFAIDEWPMIAFDVDGNPMIGDSWDDLENSTPPFGWQIQSGGWFYSAEPHTVSYVVESVHQLDTKYLPNSTIVVTLKNSVELESHTFNEIYRLMEAGFCVVLKDNSQYLSLLSYGNFSADFYAVRMSEYSGKRSFFYDWYVVNADGSVNPQTFKFLEIDM